MRHWLIVEPAGSSSEPVWSIYSDDAILASYWEYWLAKGIQYNREQGLEEGNGLNPLRCIDDWVTINWAVVATPENLVNILTAPKPTLFQD